MKPVTPHLAKCAKLGQPQKSEETKRSGQLSGSRPHLTGHNKLSQDTRCTYSRVFPSPQSHCAFFYHSARSPRPPFLQPRRLPPNLPVQIQGLTSGSPSD